MVKCFECGRYLKERGSEGEIIKCPCGNLYRRVRDCSHSSGFRLDWEGEVGYFTNEELEESSICGRAP